jgi:type II restriction enzyme
MMDAIRKDETPNFYFLHYDLATWGIRNLLLIPSFAFPTSAIIKRKPLSATARRAGWIGCNIALHRIPSDARIPVVTETVVLPANEVRARFKRVKPLSEIKAKERGWTLDVLNAVRRLAAKPANLLDCGGKRSATPFLSSAAKRFQSGVTVAALQNEFTTAEVYAFERELAQLHPGNRHVRDKIRQQLQVLRDAGLLIHVERGRWRLL